MVGEYLTSGTGAANWVTAVLLFIKCGLARISSKIKKMKPTQSLPETYQQDSIVDLSQDKRLALILNILGVILFFISGIFFINLALILRGTGAFSITFNNMVLALLGSILVVVLVLIVHEAIHGICFWYFTGEKPRFGFKGFYAYAAAPDWYLPRGAYFVTALAPLFVVTITGILLMPLVTAELLPFLLLWLVFNFSGSIGDMAMVILLLRKPATVYINDFGDGISIYCQLNQNAP